MQDTNVQKQGRALWTPILSRLPIILVLTLIGKASVTSTGVSTGTLQFDAVYEFNSPSPQTHLLLFARYWVGPDHYSMSVIWAEPHSSELWFAVYPPTFVLASDPNAFSTSHALLPTYNAAFPKPLDARGVFRNMYGDYPVTDIRFAEQEALATCVYTADLRGLQDANGPISQVLELPVPAGGPNDREVIAALKVNANEGHIDALQLLGSKRQVLKDITYEYDTVAGNTGLRRVTVKLPEQPVTVGYRGRGLVVKMEDQEYQYRDFQSVHHRGGRTAIVDYQPAVFGDREIPLPANIRVLHTAIGDVLRSVRLLNFRPTRLDAAGAKEAAQYFGGFTPEHHAYRRFLIKYWRKDWVDVNESDTQTLKELRRHFEQVGDRSTGSLGEKLRELNVLMELNRILGDETQLERYFTQYLSLLCENDCSRMALLGGASVVHTSVLWGRYSEADRLLSQWLKTALTVSNREAISRFAETDLQRGRYWIACRLLGASLESQDWGDDRFGTEVLRCTAFHMLYEQLQEPDSVKSEFGKAQVAWVMASCGLEGIAKSLRESVREAKRTSAELDEPSAEQTRLKRQLNAIEKALVQSDSPSKP